MKSGHGGKVILDCKACKSKDYESEELSKRLAKRLKEARKERALSLDALSKLSGVSRSMLSAIERSESSPTVAILWNLTQCIES